MPIVVVVSRVVQWLVVGCIVATNYTKIGVVKTTRKYGAVGRVRPGSSATVQRPMFAHKHGPSRTRRFTPDGGTVDKGCVAREGNQAGRRDLAYCKSIGGYV